MLFLTVLIGVHIINPGLNQSESFSYTTPCTLSVEGCESFNFIFPEKGVFWNLHQDQGANGLGVDAPGFIVRTGDSFTIAIPDPDGVIPEAGTFYITTDPSISHNDTIQTREPPHYTIPATVQISLRPDNTCIGYLHELINTPFIMAPRYTPAGFHQSDSRLGTDCAGLAVYGRRRMGDSIPYLGPAGILEFLERIDTGEYWNTNGVFISQSNDTARVPETGDILHFRSQVSIFLEDRGLPGVVDTEDLVIQSWFDGTHICTIGENGFADHPLRLYRWRTDYNNR